ncbi:beta-galactosidase [Pelagicoccus sp. SDUM812003]|uniref:beta-galactosidase n=1 Tax=Pelagicoccus sp. SDUM812003 TaxID=3041267 RepID=UPI0028101143|nr:beta-galactosidase [Pelagicoccus sp. SDUM812003]MDQ8205009.1 beta-galactosidase [Pelagicoccus sp. SDUM812003]
MKKLICLASLTLFMASPELNAQRTYSLDLDQPLPPVRRGHLDLGGESVTGERVSVNNQYIELNGEPWIPVVGEIHFARYPAEYWSEAIRKMKAGGINLIATYVFWNMHERVEGEFDWEGDRNLRRFLELCEANDVRAIVRMGPFCHGEVRNGGIPDWIYGRPVEIRSNDPGYLFYADRLYGQIAQQLDGLLFKDGGPVVGVQLENEYQHSAAPWEWTYPGAPREFTVADRDVDVTHYQITAGGPENKFADAGRDHMATLKKIARSHGIDVPIYTATGWGNAAIVEEGSIPVTAGYAYPFWAPPEPSDFYLFKDIRLNPDYPPISYDADLYPSIPAELGAGISLTYKRRTTVLPSSLAPLIVRTLGSGANGIGYYMYHGGSNPVIDGHFFNEQSGGLPRINYDYQAPIGEYGEMRLHHRELKLLHLLLDNWGDQLAPMPSILPETNADIEPSDVDTLRWAARTDGKSGFVFLHNFQDHVENHDLTGLRLELEGGDDEVISFPHEGTFTLSKDASGVLPFNLGLDELKLRTATVQPLTVLQNGDETHSVFMTVEGMQPELVFEGDQAVQTEHGSKARKRDGVTVVTGGDSEPFHFRSGKQHFLVIPRELALTLAHADESKLVFADADGFPAPEGLELRTVGKTSIRVQVYPTTAVSQLRSSRGTVEAQSAQKSGFAAWQVNFEAIEPPIKVRRIGERRLALSVSEEGLQTDDVWLRIPYVGDRVAAFIGGELVADHFYFGQPWDIGLRKFADRLSGEEMIFVFHPVHPDVTYLQDLPEAVQAELAERSKPLLRIENPTAQTEYRTRLTFSQ